MRLFAAAPAKTDAVYFTKQTSHIADSITDLIGSTPMVFLDKVTSDCGAKVAAKLEIMEPNCSVKVCPTPPMQGRSPFVTRPHLIKCML